MIDRFNREVALVSVFPDDQRVQYDGKDGERIQARAEAYTNATVALIKAMGEYKAEIEAPISEDSEYRVKIARQDLVKAWTDAQTALSSIAYCIRADGEEAYYKNLNAFIKDEEVSMEGF